MTNDIEVQAEIQKVKKRVPKWLSHSSENQRNSKILVRFMELLGDSKFVSYEELKSACLDFGYTFEINFNQMKIISPHNHGKVFAQKGDKIKLWKPVADFVKEQFSRSHHTHVSDDETIWNAQGTADLLRMVAEIHLGSHALNTIFYGPPGTGKTYYSVRYAVQIIDGELNWDDDNTESVLERFNYLKREHRVSFITFHQSYGYEEFIEGIKPKTKDGNIYYGIEDGIFKKFCKEAEGKNVPYVFVIDEINRGNISKIFGELITLIEDTKRIGTDEEMRTVLPYSGEEFGISKNVYIIGTMNTADRRSPALLDAVLYRRFRFKEMMPDTSLLCDFNVRGSDFQQSIDIARLMETLNNRIAVLLDREHQIGQSFFMGLKEDEPIDKLAEIFLWHIIPLLQGYFSYNYEKIRMVLGDNQKKKKCGYDCFILEATVDKNLFGSNEVEHDKRYEINASAFYIHEAYKYLQ